MGVLWNSRLPGTQSASYILGSIEIFPEHWLKWKVDLLNPGVPHQYHLSLGDWRSSSSIAKAGNRQFARYIRTLRVDNRKTGKVSDAANTLHFEVSHESA